MLILKHTIGHLYLISFVLPPPPLPVHHSHLAKISLSALYHSMNETLEVCTYDQRVCYDIDPRSISQVQGHFNKNDIIPVMFISFYCKRLEHKT